MQWLFPAVTATLCGTLIFTLVYYYLYRIENERGFKIWTISWLIYSVRFVFQLVILKNGPSVPLLVANQLSSLVSAVFLIWGTFVWVRKPLPKVWVISSILVGFWIFLSVGFRFPFPVLTLPTFFFMGVIYVWTGIVVIRNIEYVSLAKYITGWAFILWGIHKVDYPFLQPIPSTAVWGYLAVVVFMAAAALGLILVYFEKTKSELKNSDRRNRLVVDTVKGGIIFQKASGEIVTWNREAESIFGLSADDVIGRTSEHNEWMTIHEDGSPYPGVEHPSMITLRTGKPLLNQLMGVYQPDGELRWISINTSPVFQEGSPKPTDVVISFNDITEQKNAEDRIKASLKEKETLLHEIHHRVKNNMQIISSLLNLQLQKIRDDRLTEILKESRGRIYAMAAIHETLHNAGSLTEINLDDYLKKIGYSAIQTYVLHSDRINLNISCRNIVISLDNANPLGLTINELISNSLKYAFPDERPGNITIDVKKTDGFIMVVYRDDGIGLPADFDLRNSGSLGLKLVQTLVEKQLDGRLKYRFGVGVEFIMEIPLEAETA